MYKKSLSLSLVLLCLVTVEVTGGFVFQLPLCIYFSLAAHVNSGGVTLTYACALNVFVYNCWLRMTNEIRMVFNL
jgi:hypothetical protein